MKRKLIKQGKNALTITLPSQWTAVHGLKGGSEVDVTQHDDTLVIHADPPTNTSEVRITLDSDNRWYVSQVLRNAYYSGVDEIQLSFSKESMYDSARKAASLLLGFEIMDKKKGSCRIRNLTRCRGDEFSDLLRRAFRITEAVMEDMIAGKPEKEVRDRLRKAKRFILYERRILAKTRLFSSLAQHCYDSLLRTLAQVINNLLSVLDCFKRHPASRDVLDYLDKIKEMYHLLHTTLFSKDMKKLCALNEYRSALVTKELRKLLEEAPPEQRMPLHYLGEIVRLLSSAGGFIFIIQGK